MAIDVLNNILKNNPHIDTVHMCVDKDQRGDDAAERIGRELIERKLSGTEYFRN